MPKYNKIYLNILKSTYSKPIENINLDAEKFKVIPLVSGTRQDYSLSPYLFKTVLEDLARAIRKQWRSKGCKSGRKKSKYHYL